MRSITTGDSCGNRTRQQHSRATDPEHHTCQHHGKCDRTIYPRSTTRPVLLASSPCRRNPRYSCRTTERAQCDASVKQSYLTTEFTIKFQERCSPAAWGISSARRAAPSPWGGTLTHPGQLRPASRNVCLNHLSCRKVPVASGCQLVSDSMVLMIQVCHWSGVHPRCLVSLA
jgi:hypothetical protein